MQSDSDEDSTARVGIIGDGSTAVADADADGYAAARITGDSNVASKPRVGTHCTFLDPQDAMLLHVAHLPLSGIWQASAHGQDLNLVYA